MSTENLKQFLCILNPDDVSNLKKNHTEASYYCITPYEYLEMKNQGVTFPEEPHLQEGLVLTRDSSRRGYYYRTDETDCRRINERCLAIEAILSYLGGKEFRYSESSSFRSNRSVGVGVKGNIEKGGLTVDNTTEVSTTKNESKGGEKVAEAEWSGEYTYEGYSKAVELAEANGLIADPAIASLLVQRHPSHPNPIAYQGYHVNVTEDLDKNIHVLEDLSVKLKDKIGGQLTVDVSTSRKVNESATVDFFVSFGPIPVEESKQKESQTDLQEEKKKLPSRRNHHKWLWPVIVVFALAAIAATILLLFYNTVRIRSRLTTAVILGGLHHTLTGRGLAIRTRKFDILLC